MIDESLKGAVALVTGASSGIGEATAKRLARPGVAVSLVARRADRLDRIAGEITRLGGHAVPVVGDITVKDRAYGVVQDTLDRFGRLDILINNAGVMMLNSALHSRLDEWDQMISLNVTALLHVTHAAVPYLIDAAFTSPRQVADLVNIGSTADRVASPGGSVYNLTKFGLTGFTESLRRELFDEHVRVSIVEPGTVDIELVEVDPVDEATGYPAGARVDRIRQLTAWDIADVIAYIITRKGHLAVNQVLVRAG